MIKYVSGEEVLEKSVVDHMMEAALDCDEIKVMRRIERNGNSIANLMASIHGGDWVILIDHHCQYVLVQKN